MRLRAAWIVALVAGLTAPGSAPAAADRPTQADLAACREFARAQPGIPAYTETAPTNPFPWRISHVAPWTGPVTPTLAPLPRERALAPVPPEEPEPSGTLGAGGSSLESASQPGPVDPRFQEAFDACMRARGF